MPRPALTALSVFALALALSIVPAALAATHTVDQAGITFVPDDLTIEVGDTVEWVWGGTHTVTSGAHPDSAGAGDLFNEPLSAANQLVSFTFTEAGDVPYHCIPHVAFGMVGIVRVSPPTPVDEQTTASSFSRVKSLYR